MRICRFNKDRLGIVRGDQVFDVSAALKALEGDVWPVPQGDPLIRNLTRLRNAIEAVRDPQALPLASVSLHSFLTQPTKIMGAPANYSAHAKLDTLDAGVDQGVHRASLEGVEKPVEKFGLFLKANSSLVGPAEGLDLHRPERRTDHEVELVVIIGKTGKDITRENALDHVAGYALGLDVTVRGAEDRSFRKSPDGYAVLGPWLTTADEIPDPDNVEIWLDVSGEKRQRSSTAAMTVDTRDLIVLASKAYTLYPGDAIYTGTPEGVGPLVGGDVAHAGSSALGEMLVAIRNGA